MVHLVRMPNEISGLIRSGFTLSGKVGGLIYRTRGGTSHIYAIRSPKKEDNMAKIKYASFVTGLSGKSGSSVFFRSPSTSFGYMRDYAYPTLTEENTQRGLEFKNMTAQIKKMDELAVGDLKIYANKYSKLPTVGKGDLAARANNYVAVWILALWNLKKNIGETIALNSITLDDLTTLYMWTSVAGIVEEGYLPVVEGYEDLDNLFDPS